MPYLINIEDLDPQIRKSLEENEPVRAWYVCPACGAIFERHGTKKDPPVFGSCYRCCYTGKGPFDQEVISRKAREYNSGCSKAYKIETNQKHPEQTVNLTVLRLGTKIIVSHFPFVIGRNITTHHTLLDYSIDDNPRVSRRHAMITQNNGECYVEDIYTLSGTFVNGHGLTPGVKQKIEQGDIITLADEKIFVEIGSAIER